MTPTPQDSQDESLADTSIGSSHSGVGLGGSGGGGCLLQIYPVPDRPGLLPLAASRSVIGRDSTCHITVNDSSVSRTHAAVQWSGGTYSITDLNSTNGSWINETKLESQSELAGGELIRLGNTILKFILLVDEETQYHNIVHEVMTRDALTNTLNRGSLFPLLERELQLCREESTALSVIFLDVDQFKLVNDQHGHLVGDKVLRIFCERIRTILDSTHSLCRFGGDEFVIVCPGSELEMTVQLAELIRSEIADTPFEIQNGQLNITCSLGVTCTDGHTLSDVDSLLSAADRLLYCAKDEGRNRLFRADGREIVDSDSSRH